MSLRLNIESIKTKLQNPLPAWEGQKHMAPDFRQEEIERMRDKMAQARQSAVLILLYEKEGQLYFPCIQRAAYDGVHSGQISLPGGQRDENDPDFAYTALRETQEEIGVPINQLELLGQLSDLYIPPSNFLVKVFLAWSKSLPTFIPDPVEVDNIVEVELQDLWKNENIKRKVFYRSSDGKEKTAPYYDVAGVEIWGATAMILGELAELMK
jgi:8-oxo-dGTP pyrophosphatase MutT (NUDIX family)